MNVRGPINILTREGYEYFMSFSYDLSRYGYVYLMNSKSKSFKMLREFKAVVKMQLSKSLKSFQSD